MTPSPSTSCRTRSTCTDTPRRWPRWRAARPTPGRPRCSPGTRRTRSRSRRPCTARCSPTSASTRWPSSRPRPAPTNLAYVSYLLAATSTGSYAEGVGAVLPCYWIYWEVGKELVRRGSPDPRYQQWIDTYGGEEFGDVVRAVIDVTDELGPGPRRGRAGPGAPALPCDQPLRVDVLGHGLPQGSLARLILVVAVRRPRHLGRVGLGAVLARRDPGVPAAGVRVLARLTVLAEALVSGRIRQGPLHV